MISVERKPTTDLSKSTIPIDSLTVTPPQTQNATSTSTHQLVSEIRNIYVSLSKLSSLAPLEPVNTLLTQLVNLCVIPYSAKFTSYFFSIPGVESLCTNLRPLCSEAEAELERYWARRMLDNLSKRKTPEKRIFPSFISESESDEYVQQLRTHLQLTFCKPSPTTKTTSTSPA
jgi:nicotianamine synthase